VANSGVVGYSGRNVLRRSTAFFAFLSLVTAPVVTSTRLFCRYTGQEITDCAKADISANEFVGTDTCCEQRTFRALDGVRLVDEHRQQAPTPVAIDTAPSLLVHVFAPAATQPPQPSASCAGPPAFISHRALLI
jgi:hypothetical protein